MKLTDLASLLALVALGWGVYSHRRAQEMEARLENMRHSHFRLADQTRETLARLDSELRTLKLQVRALKGDEPLYQAEMTIGEAVALDPRASEVLGSFHIGGCSSCAVSPEDTLGQAATASGQPLETILQALNKLPTTEAGEVARLLERKPNVQITL